MPKTACSKRALPLLVITTLSLTACATAPSKAFSEEVDTGSMIENAEKQKHRAADLIQSDR